MPLVQDWSLDLLISSPICYHCTTDAPHYVSMDIFIYSLIHIHIFIDSLIHSHVSGWLRSLVQILGRISAEKETATTDMMLDIKLTYSDNVHPVLNTLMPKLLSACTVSIVYFEHGYNYYFSINKYQVVYIFTGCIEMCLDIVILLCNLVNINAMNSWLKQILFPQKRKRDWTRKNPICVFSINELGPNE